MPSDHTTTAQNVAYLQNAPTLEFDADLVQLSPEEVKKRMTKWDKYDELFKKLREDALVLYSQFEVNEETIDAMVWPADSHAKTQIYKLEHFLRLYHEGRCRELNDVLKALLSLLHQTYGEQWDRMQMDAAPLD